MTPEEIKAEKKRRRLLAAFRFKTLIRKVIVSRYWLMELEKQPFGDNIRRNVAIICRHQKPTCPITIAEKAILNLPGSQRTKEQDGILAKKLIDLKCLACFPPSLRLSMMKKMQYQYYQRGRTITREGHYPSAIYFILDGRVDIVKTQFDPIERKYNEIVAYTKITGDIFGQTAPLHNCNRVITSRTASDCELLILFIQDLDDQILGILKQQWDDIRTALKRFECFSKFSEDQIRECCFISRMQKYNEDDIIYNSSHANVKYTHVQCSGKSMILQGLRLKKTILKSGRKKVELMELHEDDGTLKRVRKNRSQLFGTPLDCDKFPAVIEPEDEDEEEGNPEEEEIVDDSNNMNNVIYETKFTEVGIMHCGSMFGLGENMDHRMIIAKSTVDCLLIPRIWLFQKEQNTGNVFQSLKMFLDSTIPSRQKIFDNYISEIAWMKYRQALIKKSIDMKEIRNPTQHYDIPVTCRIMKIED